MAELKTAVKALEAQAPCEKKGVQAPKLIGDIIKDWTSKRAHVYGVHGNVNDYQDNYGVLPDLPTMLSAVFDDNTKNVLDDQAKLSLGINSERGLQGQTDDKKIAKATKLCGVFTMTSGLSFVSEDSEKAFAEALNREYKNEISKQLFPADFLKPQSFGSCIFTLNKWFDATKKVAQYNIKARVNRQMEKPEYQFTVVFMDADALFPSGNIGQMAPADRDPIVVVRNWARDQKLGEYNRIILVTQHISQIHESIRGGTSGVSSHLIPKPTLEDRLEFLENYSHNIAELSAERKRIKGKGLTYGGREVTGVELAKDFDLRQFAVQAAGMSRKHMEEVFTKSWLTNVPVDSHAVRERKQEAIQEEYEGLVDFYEPTFGFEIIGGHDHLKQYAQDKIIEPLLTGNRRQCTRGVLLTGPAGTGKTMWAKGLAKECKVNFLEARVDRFFDSLVGGSESKTRKFFEAVEATQPCVVFFDEIDSAFSSGRTSVGDSGTSGRVFNQVMTWLSDDARQGKVVVVAATNRPDLLDEAFIRAGRFDAKLPVLPPHSTDAEGKAQLLNALTRKLGVKMESGLATTLNDPMAGLGKLVKNEDQVYTGAEIEQILKCAIDLMVKRNGKSINQADWEMAFDNIICNTGRVEYHTMLSLKYVDNLLYCPAEWKEQARDKNAIETRLQQERV